LKLCAYTNVQAMAYVSKTFWSSTIGITIDSPSMLAILILLTSHYKAYIYSNSSIHGT